MDLAWLAPPLVLLAGAAGAAVLLAAIARSIEEAKVAHRRIKRLEGALIPLRVETRRTRESLDRFPRR